jgi:hypothetical protein
MTVRAFLPPPPMMAPPVTLPLAQRVLDAHVPGVVLAQIVRERRVPRARLDPRTPANA